MASLDALGGGALERALQVVAVVAKVGHGGVRLHIHHEVGRPVVETERLPLAAVDLAGPSLQPVTDVCFSQFLRRGNAEAREGETVGCDEEDGIAGENFGARVVDAKEIAALGEPLLLRQCLGPRHLRRPDACGPCAGGAKALPGHPSFASGRGSRACACDGGCWAEKYASLTYPSETKARSIATGPKPVKRTL